MGTQRHGLSIGIERVGSRICLTLRPVGKLTHDDYGVINPMVDGALEGIEAPKIRALIDGTEFDGWEARAAWDDVKFGARHRKEFERVAIVGSHRWQPLAAKVGSWFTTGEVRSFAGLDEAVAWLAD